MSTTATTADGDTDRWAEHAEMIEHAELRSERDWFTEVNRSSIVEVAELAADIAESVNAVEEYEYYFTEKELDEETAERYRGYLEDDAEELRDALSTQFDLLVQLFTTGIDDVDTAFSAGDHAESEYHNQDLPKNIRSHTLNYLNALSDVLVDGNVELLIDGIEDTDTCGEVIGETVEHTESWLDALDYLFRTMEDELPTSDDDDDETPDVSPVTAVEDVLWEQLLSTETGALRVDRLSERVEERAGIADIQDRRLWTYLTKIDSSGGIEHPEIEGVCIWDKLHGDRIWDWAMSTPDAIIDAEERERRPDGELMDEEIALVVALDLPAFDHHDIEWWRDCRSPAEMREDLLDMYTVD